MPAATTDYKKVIKAREEAKKRGESAAGRVGMANTFESRLRDRLRKQKVSEGASRLEEMAGAAWGDYSGARGTVSKTFPNLRPGAFTQQVNLRQAGSMREIGKIAAMQQTRQQGIGDIIAGVAAGIQAETQKQQALAQQAQQAYQNIFGEYQFGEEQRLAQQKLNLAGQPTPEELSPEDKLAVEVTKREALGALREAVSAGEITNRYDAITQLNKLGVDHRDPMFAELLAGLPETAPVEEEGGYGINLGQKASGLVDWYKNILDKTRPMFPSGPGT